MSEAPVTLINYYIRNGYCHHAQTVCNEWLKKRQNDPTMVFWRAVAMLKEGQASEAVRELEGLAKRADAQMKLPVNIALLHSHRACKIADNEAIAQLEDYLMSGAEDSAPDRARLTAAQLFWHLGEIYDAKNHLGAIPIDIAAKRLETIRFIRPAWDLGWSFFKSHDFEDFLLAQCASSTLLTFHQCIRHACVSVFHSVP